MVRNTDGTDETDDKQIPDVVNKAVEDTKDAQLLRKVSEVLRNPNTDTEEKAEAIRSIVEEEP